MANYRYINGKRVSELTYQAHRRAENKKNCFLVGSVVIFLACYVGLYYMVTRGLFILPELLSSRLNTSQSVVAIAGVITAITAVCKINYILGKIILTALVWALFIGVAIWGMLFLANITHEILPNL